MKKILLIIATFASTTVLAQNISSVSLYNKSTFYEYNIGDTVQIQITLFNKSLNTDIVTIKISENTSIKWDSTMLYSNMAKGKSPNQFIYKWVAQTVSFAGKSVTVNGSAQNAAAFSVSKTPNGIEESIYNNTGAKVIGMYDILGNKLDAPLIGSVTLVQYSNGSVRKIVMQ